MPPLSPQCVFLGNLSSNLYIATTLTLPWTECWAKDSMQIEFLSLLEWGSHWDGHLFSLPVTHVYHLFALFLPKLDLPANIVSEWLPLPPSSHLLLLAPELDQPASFLGKMQMPWCEVCWSLLWAREEGWGGRCGGFGLGRRTTGGETLPVLEEQLEKWAARSKWESPRRGTQ